MLVFYANYLVMLLCSYVVTMITKLTYQSAISDLICKTKSN